MYAIEQKSASEIARYLTDRRIPNSRGNTVWSSSSIIGVIKRRWRCSAASAEGSTIEYDEQGKQHGCDVSMLLSDDCAWDLLHTALISILSASTDVIQPLLFAIKSAIAGDKSGEYDGNRTNDIEQILSQLLTGETKSDVFCKAVLDCITVFKDKHIELQLIHLPYRFIFQSTKKRHS